MLLIGGICFNLSAHNLRAEANDEPDLLIGQIKITSNSGQFITLYNNSTETIDMSSVQLAYFNNYDLSKATSSRFITLSGKLPPLNYYLVSDGAVFICYKMTVNSVSLGFSSTAGQVQVLKLSQKAPGSPVTSVLHDAVAWSKSSASGAQTLPSQTTDFLQRVWPVNMAKSAGGGSWQVVKPNINNVCDLQTQLEASATPEAEVLAAATPPVTTLPAEAPKDEVKILLNVGLTAPELTELFPNPASPQTDDEDEFIELYNPNELSYDLAGYRLEAGSSYSRGHTFKEGSIPAKSFVSFSIKDTKLQLSNSEGQVRLLAPDGTVISESASYEDAPDGESWSLVADSWQWTNQTTAGSLNLASKTADTEVSDSASSTRKPAAKVASASTGTTADLEPGQLDDATPLHPLTLAGVGTGAVAYALYEYRRDMANRIFQLKRYFRLRRAGRP
jgi:hypothetical protein